MEDGGEDILDVIVDWLLLVELGPTEALPVISGESVTEPKIHQVCGSLTKYAPPASCAAVSFQEPDCGGKGKRLSEKKK